MPRVAVASRSAVVQQQNLCTRSEEFDNAAWNANSAITVTANATTDPIGGSSADQLTPNGGVNRHYAAQTFAIAASYAFSPRQMCMSCFIKPRGGAQWAYLLDERHTDFVYAWFDVLNGVVGSVTANNPTAIMGTSGIESRGSGWFRCWMNYMMISPSGGAGMNAQCVGVGPTTGDAVQIYDSAAGVEVYVWGAQVVCGPRSPGPYVQTVAAIVDTGAVRTLRSLA